MMKNSNTYTYDHTDLPETQIYVYGVDLGADPGDEDDLLVAGMGNNINASISQAPTPTVEEIQPGMGGASLPLRLPEPAAAPVIQSATRSLLLVAVLETTYFLDGAVIGYSESYGSLEEGYKSTEYYDANHAPLGNSWEDSYGGSGSSFNIILAADDIPLDDDDNPVVDAGGATHVIQETSQSTYIEGDMTDSSSSVHYYVAAMDGDGNPTGEIDWVGNSVVSLRWSVMCITA